MKNRLNIFLLTLLTILPLKAMEYTPQQEAEQHNADNQFLQLPDELWLHILKNYQGLNTLKPISQVCQKLRILTQDRILKKIILQKEIIQYLQESFLQYNPETNTIREDFDSELNNLYIDAEIFVPVLNIVCQTLIYIKEQCKDFNDEKFAETENSVFKKVLEKLITSLVERFKLDERAGFEDLIYLIHTAIKQDAIYAFYYLTNDIPEIINQNLSIKIEPIKISNLELQIATENNSVNCIDCFIKKLKINPNEIDEREFTVLDYAIYQGNEEAIQALLDCGAKTNHYPQPQSK